MDVICKFQLAINWILVVVVVQKYLIQQMPVSARPHTFVYNRQNLFECSKYSFLLQSKKPKRINYEYRFIFELKVKVLKNLISLNIVAISIFIKFYLNQRQFLVVINYSNMEIISKVYVSILLLQCVVSKCFLLSPCALFFVCHVTYIYQRSQ